MHSLLGGGVSIKEIYTHTQNVTRRKEKGVRRCLQEKREPGGLGSGVGAHVGKESIF